MFCGIGLPAGTYGDVGGMRSVPQIFFGMTRLRGSAVFDGGAFGNIEGIVESAQGWGMACL